jgi:hypothetical protein
MPQKNSYNTSIKRRFNISLLNFFSIRLIVISCFAFFYASIAYSQKTTSTELPKKSTVRIIDGVKYYIHSVEKGETLYGIAQQYECNTSDILLENPEAMNGTKPDM